jgi:hypothetical protein
VYVVGLWKNIRRGWKKFGSHIRFEVRDGSKVRFWHDLWCGNTALKEAFPVLFGIAYIKDAFVATIMDFSGYIIHWNVNFTRAVHDWEVEAFASFFRVLYLARVRQEREDKLWWLHSKKGLFGVNPSLVSWVVMMVSVSLGKMLGVLRFHFKIEKDFLKFCQTNPLFASVSCLKEKSRRTT